MWIKPIYSSHSIALVLTGYTHLSNIKLATADSEYSTCPEELLCSDLEVCDMLSTLDITKASGPDGISTRMLKNTAPDIGPSLIKLLNLSISTGNIPSSWEKKSLVVPIPKCQELSSLCNYRPISILPIDSKILERHIYMLLMDHLENNHPLSAFQFLDYC